MAKSEKHGFIELHIEKIVLGVSALILVVVAGMSLVGTEKLELPVGPGGSVVEVPAAEADEELSRAAGQLPSRIARKPVPTYEEPDFVEVFDRLAAVPYPPSLGRMGDFGEPYAALSVDVEEMAQASLAAVAEVMPEPIKPAGNLAWVVPFLRAPQPDGRGRRPAAAAAVEPPELTEKAVACFASEYDRSALLQAWEQELKETAVSPYVIVYDQQIHMQVRDDDGNWSEPTEIEPVALVNPAAPEGGGFRRGGYENMYPGGYNPPTMYEDYNYGRGAGERGDPNQPPEIPEYDGTPQSFQAVRQAVMARMQWQPRLLNPPYHYYLHFASRTWLPWQNLLPETPAFQAYLADIEKRRTGGGGVPGMGMEVVDVQAPQAVDLAWIERVREEPVEEEDPRRRRTPREPRRPGYDERYGPPPDDFYGPGGPGDYPTPTPRRRPGRPRYPGETEREQDPDLPPPPPEAPLVPTWNWQQTQGKQVFWFFYDQLKAGRTYRFRVRLRMINPLLLYEQDVAQPEDARTKLVATPWSDWSDPASLPRKSWFFLTGAREDKNTVSVTVFQERFDQIVSARVFVRPGESIRAEQEIEILNPLTGTVDERTVDFSTGATVVDIDFRREPVGASAVSRATQELFYQSREGDLLSRLRIVDRQDPTRTELEKQLREKERFLEEVERTAAYLKRQEEERERMRQRGRGY